MTIKRPVVITGLGVVSGLGIGIDPLWESLLEGKHAISPIQAFDAKNFPVRFASEVGSDFKLRDYVPKNYRKALKVMCRDIELAVAAASKAVEDAKLITKAVEAQNTEKSNVVADETGQSKLTYKPSRVGCQIGAGLIVAEINELTSAFSQARNNDDSFSMEKWGNTGMNELTPLWLLKYLPNMLACHVTIIHDCQGPSNTITCAEASGALSIGESMRVIERGDADLCFSGGAESKINMLAILRQWHSEMLADTFTYDKDPGSLVQPFGLNASGSVPGEAAALLTIEAKETAQGRDAAIYAEIAGFGAGQSCDLQNHGLKPHPEGKGLAAAIRRALTSSGIIADDIHAIVPMGMGTPAYDQAEVAALLSVFGEHLLSTIPLITTKPNLGLCAAATSAIDIAVGALCLKHQVLPARINGNNILEGLNAGSAEQRDAALENVLVCGCGFGGQNYAIVLKNTG